jgi:flagellar assembly protein FliH
MSSDPVFATLSFPSLRTSAPDDGADRARIGGHAAGYAAGLRAAEADVAARVAALEAEHAATLAHLRARHDLAVATLARAAAALDARTVPVLEEAHAAIADAAVQLAEAVVVSELGDAGASARSALHRALDSVDVGTVHAVRLNPSDLSSLDETAIGATGVSLVADPSLGRGDAVTEFADGYLDARVSTAFARARAAIEGARA